MNARELVSLFCECEIRESAESQFPFLFCWWSMRPARTTETEEKGEWPEGAVIEGAPCPGQESKKHIRAYLYSFTCSFQYGSANRRENGKIFLACGRQNQKYSFC